jgi:hypothetical protein
VHDEQRSLLLVLKQLIAMVVVMVVMRTSFISHVHVADGCC